MIFFNKRGSTPKSLNEREGDLQPTQKILNLCTDYTVGVYITETTTETADNSGARSISRGMTHNSAIDRGGVGVVDWMSNGGINDRG